MGSIPASRTMPTGQQHDRGDKRIFVQMPAYRDPELGPTLIDLFSKALFPEALRVVVLWQRSDDERIDGAILRNGNIELIDVPFRESCGCNWARSLIQRRWNGEPYTLILDSHHRFAKHWDDALIQAYDRLIGSGVSKPIITAYLPPYTPQDEPHGRKKRPLKIYPFERSDGLLLRLIGRPIVDWQKMAGPVPGDFLSLHCLFAAGQINLDVPFDPDCYFFGDEVSISLRAFTKGYDFYHPHRVIGWHCYDRSYRPQHWDDHEDWSRHEARSMARMKRLLSGRLSGPYGGGSQRSLSDFEDRVLVKLAERT